MPIKLVPSANSSRTPDPVSSDVASTPAVSGAPGLVTPSYAFVPGLAPARRSGAEARAEGRGLPRRRRRRLDPVEDVVHIVRQLRIIRGRLVFAPPKGGKARTVPLPAEVGSAVACHREDFSSVLVSLPWLDPGGRTIEADLLLTNERGRPHSGGHVNEVMWRGALRVAGLDYARRTDGMHCG